MELNTINSQSTWGKEVDNLNKNFQKVDDEMTKLQNATYKNKGYFSTVEKLKEAFPNATVGSKAYVGTSYPYAIWVWIDGVWTDSGKTGGEESLNLNEYIKEEDAINQFSNKAETDEKLTELAREVIKFVDFEKTPENKRNFVGFVKECYVEGEGFNSEGVYRINSVRKNDAGRWIVNLQDFNDTSKYLQCTYNYEESNVIVLDNGTIDGVCYLVCDWSYVADGSNTPYIYFRNTIFNVSNSPIISSYFNTKKTIGAAVKDLATTEYVDKKTDNSLKEDSLDKKIVSKNLANPNNITVGDVSDGSLNNSDNGWKKIVIPLSSDMEGEIFSFGNYNLGRSGYYVFTDENDSYLIERQSFSNPSTINGKTIATPTGSKKLYIDVKASGYEEELNTLTVNIGSQLISYEPYEERIVGINGMLFANVNTAKGLNDCSEKIRNTFYDNSFLWDENNENVTPQAGVDEDRFHTDFIPVVEGFAFELKTWFGSTKWVSLVTYNSNKEIISSQCVSGSYSGYLEVSNDVKYVVASSTRIGVGNSKEFYIRYVEKKKKLINKVSHLKYPSLLSNRGCMAFQIDCSQYTCGYEKILNILREYGLMSVDFALNAKMLEVNVQPVDYTWFAEKQDEGCEIIYHNLIGTHSDFSESSSLSVEECREGIESDLMLFKSCGFTSYGVVANEGKLAERYKPMVDSLFSWSEYQSAQILSNQNLDTTKDSWVSDHRVHRTGFDMSKNASDDVQNEVIAKGKLFIDNIINNKSMGVMYCHGINNAEAESRITEKVLRELASYIKEKVSEGVLVWGNTSECLNYLLQK